MSAVLCTLQAMTDSQLAVQVGDGRSAHCVCELIRARVAALRTRRRRDRLVDQRIRDHLRHSRSEPPRRCVWQHLGPDAGAVVEEEAAAGIGEPETPSELHIPPLKIPVRCRRLRRLEASIARLRDRMTVCPLRSGRRSARGCRLAARASRTITALAAASPAMGTRVHHHPRASRCLSRPYVRAQGDDGSTAPPPAPPAPQGARKREKSVKRSGSSRSVGKKAAARPIVRKSSKAAGGLVRTKAPKVSLAVCVRLHVRLPISPARTPLRSQKRT
jgi:hypothetical protein